MSEPRPVARGVVRRDDELLVTECIEDGQRVYVPPGEQVAGEEDATDAVARVFSDLLGVEVSDARDLGTFDGTRVFEVALADRWVYDEEGFTVYDPESGETTRVCWLHVDDFRKYGETLRPSGLLDAFDRWSPTAGERDEA